MLGKPKDKIVGVLPMCAEWFLQHDDTKSITISALEVYGISTQRIDIYDLLLENNLSAKKWKDKTTLSNNQQNIPEIMTKIDVATPEEAYNHISKAQLASHFAPTGKNPESSRGHIVFIISVVNIFYF